MTEPKVEAGDRALARKCVEAVLLDTLGEACLNELDEPLIDEVAEMIQSAMNAQERELETKLRRCMWERHGHSKFLYGDDGEMQCNGPNGADFKRDPIEALERHMHEAGLERLAEAERLLAERGGTQ